MGSVGVLSWAFLVEIMFLLMGLYEGILWDWHRRIRLRDCLWGNLSESQWQRREDCLAPLRKESEVQGSLVWFPLGVSADYSIHGSEGYLWRWECLNEDGRSEAFVAARDKEEPWQYLPAYQHRGTHVQSGPRGWEYYFQADGVAQVFLFLQGLTEAG